MKKINLFAFLFLNIFSFQTLWGLGSEKKDAAKAGAFFVQKAYHCVSSDEELTHEFDIMELDLEEARKKSLGEDLIQSASKSYRISDSDIAGGRTVYFSKKDLSFDISSGILAEYSYSSQLNMKKVEDSTDLIGSYAYNEYGEYAVWVLKYPQPKSSVKFDVECEKVKTN